MSGTPRSSSDGYEPLADRPGVGASRTTPRRIPTLYFDGACKGNPGPVAYGFVLYNETGDEICDGSRFFADHETNNVAEYRALEEGLRAALDAGLSQLRVRGDSELVIKQLRGDHNAPSDNLAGNYERVLALIEGFEGVIFEHVDRSNNSRADGLASAALDNVHA